MNNNVDQENTSVQSILPLDPSAASPPVYFMGEVDDGSNTNTNRPSTSLNTSARANDEASDSDYIDGDDDGTAIKYSSGDASDSVGNTEELEKEIRELELEQSADINF